MVGLDLTRSAAELGREIGAGEIDPVDLTEAYFDAISKNELSARIYARTTEERARSEAIAARDRAAGGNRKSLLDGVPISWKDLFDTAGIGTEAGTALLKDRVPDCDAEVLQSATGHGLICLGKTHMSELAFSGLGLNPVTETPPCVNDLEAVSGGSSSGAAASVAFGLAAAGIGSDTGGSVRIPAAWNDLVGLKTTAGNLSLKGVVPLCARFDTVGPLTRTVEDAALLYSAMSSDPTIDLDGVDLSGRCFGILETLALDDVRDEPAKAFEHAIAKIQAAGARVVPVKSDTVTDAMSLAPYLYAPEAYGQWKDEIEANPELMFSEILERFRAGASVSGPEFVKAWIDLEGHQAQYHQETAGFDAILCPTSPAMPPNLDRLLAESDFYVAENLLALRNTRIGNLLKCAALTLPTGFASCGLMVMGAPSSEGRLLRLGRAIEQALT